MTDEQAKTDEPVTELEQRSERIKMLCEIAAKTRAVAREAADRLYGTEPQPEECDQEDRGHGRGSFGEMDASLDSLEVILREAERETSRLSRT
ncbi:MAG: hypothetical protein RI571_06460 [Roseovarius sp.]|nr:hypothetical protein [Roseovarius sp.]